MKKPFVVQQYTRAEASKHGNNEHYRSRDRLLGWRPPLEMTEKQIEALHSGKTIKCREYSTWYNFHIEEFEVFLDVDEEELRKKVKFFINDDKHATIGLKSDGWVNIDFRSIKKGKRAYLSGKLVMEVEDRHYEVDELLAAINEGIEKSKQRSTNNLIKKNPLIGGLLNHVLEKHSNAFAPGPYIKHGKKNGALTMVAVPFTHACLYFGVKKNGTMVVMIDRPEMGAQHPLGDINDPKAGAIEKMMEIVKLSSKMEAIIRGRE